MDASDRADRKLAWKAVKRAIRCGMLAHPSRVPCTDCGHVCPNGPFPLAPRHHHEYDHYLGYQAINRTSVQSVCSRCHKKRSRLRGEGTGRPNTGARARRRIGFRALTADQLARYKAAAAQAGETLNDFARCALELRTDSVLAAPVSNVATQTELRVEYDPEG